MMVNLTVTPKRMADTITIREMLFFPYNLDVFILMLLSLIMAWLIHEAMHYYEANRYGLKPYYSWDDKGSFVSIKKTPTEEQHKKIIHSGVYVGMIPIILTTLVIGLWSIIPLSLYILGCNSDLKELYLKKKIIKKV